MSHERAPAKQPKAPRADIPEKYHDPATSGLQIEVITGDNPAFDFDLVPRGR